MTINKTVTSTYEAAFYLIHGAKVDSFHERQVSVSKIKRSGYRNQWVFRMTNIPKEITKIWSEGKALAYVRDIESRRRYLKRKAKTARV